MNGSQSPPVPAPGTRPRPHDLGWLLRYSARGLRELVRARIAFAALKASDIPARNAAAKARGSVGAAADAAVAARISYVLPRLSARLPWRSDCLIQAIAGQNWLAAHGFASEIRLGVRRDENEAFGAHAWLVHDGQIISGGDISSYELLLGDPDSTPERN